MAHADGEALRFSIDGKNLTYRRGADEWKLTRSR
jgi:hypothetical protein